MTSDTAPKPYKLLSQENVKLRQRIMELEKMLKCSSSTSIIPTDTQNRMFELVKHKDRALSEYAKRMEQKARELGNMVQELNTRNDELANGMAILHLYQLIFENEPAGIVGIDREGRIIQFNSAAVKYFGVGLHSLRLAHINKLEIPGSKGFDFEQLFERTIDAENDIVDKVNTDKGILNLRCYRLDDAAGLRGIVMRVSKADNLSDNAGGKNV